MLKIGLSESVTDAERVHGNEYVGTLLRAAFLKEASSRPS